MDLNGTKSPHEDKWDAEGGRQSLQSAKKGSRGSHRCQEEDNDDENADKTRTWLSDSDQDQRSDVDGQRSTPSFYSDEYDSPSEDSRSPYSQSRIPYYSPQRRIQAKTTSSTPINKKGMRCKKKKTKSVVCLNVQVMAVWALKPWKQYCHLRNSLGQSLILYVSGQFIKHLFGRLRGASRCLWTRTSSATSSLPATP